MKYHQLFIFRFVVFVLEIWRKSWKVRDCLLFLASTFKRASWDVVQIEEHLIFSGVNFGCLRTVTDAFRYIAGVSCLPSARSVV